MAEHLNGTKSAESQSDGESSGSTHDCELPSQASNVPERGTHPTLSPLVPLDRPRRKVDLSVVSATLPSVKAVESLDLTKLTGAAISPRTDLMLAFDAIAHKAGREFEETFQIISGALLSHPLVARKARKVAFIPAFVWPTLTVAICPLKLTPKYGQVVLGKLERVQPLFPTVKIDVEWDGRQHLVWSAPLSEQESRLLENTKWPTKDDICKALSPYAYECLADLAADNPQIHTMLNAREVL